MSKPISDPDKSTGIYRDALAASHAALLAALEMIHLSFGGGNVITFSDSDIEQIAAAIKTAKELGC